MSKFRLKESYKRYLRDFQAGKISQNQFIENCVALSPKTTTSKTSNKNREGVSLTPKESTRKRRPPRSAVIKEQEYHITRKGNRVLKSSIRKGELLGSFEVFEFVLNTILEKVGKPELIPKVHIGKAIVQFQTLHNNLITEHGIKFGTAKWNSIKNYCIQLLEGNLNPEHPERVATGRVDGWPRAINITRQLFFQVRDRGPYAQEADQIIRSLFAMNRVIEDFSEMSLDSIEYKAVVDPQFLEDFTQFLDELFGDCQIVGGLSPRMDQKNSFVLQTKLGIVPYSYDIKPPLSFISKGPNGVQKTDSAPYEAYLLSRDIGSKELYPHIKRIARLANDDNFVNFIESNADLYLQSMKEINKLPNNGKFPLKGKLIMRENLSDQAFWACCPKVDESRCKTLRKITSVPDSGNKSRVVAIPDYWTQCALAPFEDNILNVIKVAYPNSSNIFDHPGGFKKLQNAIKPGTSSLDATSWTDTFSSKIQKRVVSKLFGIEFNDAWSRLVVHCHWNVKNTDSRVRYQTGQGMGTKGSFQIASLTYLLVMEFLTKKNYSDEYERRSKSRDFTDLFNQIGDDSWNQDPDGTVRKDLIELVGMPINLSKSKFSTDENLVGEYVSRNINYGKDVSRISLNLCRQVGKNFFYLPDLIKHLEERTVSFDIYRLIEFLRARVKHDGKPYYKDHIWSSFYKTLIVDNIINDDKVFYRLLIDLERSLSQTPEKVNDLTILRSHFTERTRFATLKFLLLLQDCEYMYSTIEQSFYEISDRLREYPIDRSTISFNGQYFRMEFFIQNKGFLELSALRASYTSRELIRDGLFKLSLDTFNVSNIESLNESLAEMQKALIEIHKVVVYGKYYENKKILYKQRIDRAYNIQKTYVNGMIKPDNLASTVLQRIPNLALIGDVSQEDFDWLSSHLESVYPLHEDVIGHKIPTEISHEQNSREDDSST